ncbi:hypothetical protein MUU72_22680 [Streptomyces sp. RS10V-4]|uniref:DUF6585 family protein n=1 Tax=Streptomyces rhizoryzae TaxID=2932493 RepID=UPI002006B3FE|nr:DUF6585 family protein [Streptomyces rhizoryzae]MCK7625873.1 hypothetical protein [Streptomyces rhizoryzae]
MTGPAPRTRGEELLLARVSAAAGRARLGRRLATHPATAYRPRARTGLFRVLGRRPARVPYGRATAARASPNARLDLYEHGMTVAVQGRIHVVRYATTAVFRQCARPRGGSPAGAAVLHTLTDVEHRRLVLVGGPAGGDPRPWEHELPRAVLRAQLPGALAALRRGERVCFGEIWLTREGVGAGALCAPWQRVRRIGVQEGFVVLTLGGQRHRLGPAVSGIPNLFVFRALAEQCRTGDVR